jgi:hypothetical protein
MGLVLERRQVVPKSVGGPAAARLPADQETQDVAAADDPQQQVRFLACDDREAIVLAGIEQLADTLHRVVWV